MKPLRHDQDAAEAESRAACLDSAIESMRQQLARRDNLTQAMRAEGHLRIAEWATQAAMIRLTIARYRETVPA